MFLWPSRELSAGEMQSLSVVWCLWLVCRSLFCFCVFHFHWLSLSLTWVGYHLKCVCVRLTGVTTVTKSIFNRNIKVFIVFSHFFLFKCILVFSYYFYLKFKYICVNNMFALNLNSERDLIGITVKSFLIQYQAAVVNLYFSKSCGQPWPTPQWAVCTFNACTWKTYLLLVFLLKPPLWLSFDWLMMQSTQSRVKVPCLIFYVTSSSFSELFLLCSDLHFLEIRQPKTQMIIRSVSIRKNRTLVGCCAVMPADVDLIL